MGVETKMSGFRWPGKRGSNTNEYATRQEFVSLFECERLTLRRLALLLTANAEAAEHCLVRALGECMANYSVSREWALVWARRVVIRNAINVVMDAEEQSFKGMYGDAVGDSTAFSEDRSLGRAATSKAILALPDLDRFVFVICVLERFSIHDCALLLGRSPRDIDEAHRKVVNQIEQVNESNDGSLGCSNELAQAACPCRGGE